MNLFKDNKSLNYVVNLCGLFLNRPNMPLSKWFDLVDETFREIADNGASGVLMWLPWPMAWPANTPKWRQDEMLVSPKNDVNEWEWNFNEHFKDKIFWPTMLLLNKYNLIPVIGLTGYTNKQILYKKDKLFRSATLYGRVGTSIKFIIESIKFLQCDPDWYFELANEPEAGMMLHDKQQAKYINVGLTRWHILLINELQSIGIHDSHIICNPWEGIDVNTFKDDPTAVQIAGLLSQSLSGELDPFLDEDDIWKDENRGKEIRYDHVFSAHACGTWEQAVRCSSIRRIPLQNMIISLDGAATKTGGIYGNDLYGLARDALEREKLFDVKKKPAINSIRAKRLVIATHPRGIYDAESNNPAEHTILLENVDEKYYKPVAQAIHDVTGRWPENFGKYPPKDEPEPEEPTEPVEPEPGDEPGPVKKSKIGTIIAIFTAIVIAVLLIIILT